MNDKTYVYACVLFASNMNGTYTYIADEEIHAGDIAVVETAEGEKYTLVAYLVKGTAEEAPYPFEKLKHITARVPKGSPDYAALYDKYLKRRPRFSDDLFYPDDFYDD